MGNPNSRDLNDFKKWMESPSLGNMMLIGEDSDIWAEQSPDLVALRDLDEKDPLFRFLSTGAIQKYHELLGHHIRVCIISNISDGPCLII